MACSSMVRMRMRLWLHGWILFTRPANPAGEHGRQQMQPCFGVERVLAAGKSGVFSGAVMESRLESEPDPLQALATWTERRVMPSQALG